MVVNDELLAYLNVLLQSDKCPDYCPNGLQVAGQYEIFRIATGVSLNVEFIRAAIDEGADTLLVHHGLFWDKESPCLVGAKRRRANLLLDEYLNLFAYHLPLDVHPVYGNNAQLAKKLNIQVSGTVKAGGVDNLLTLGRLENRIEANAFVDHIAHVLDSTPFHVAPKKSKDIKNVAICSGGGQSYFQEAIALGIDAYITGEFSEPVYHLAKESGVHYFGCGHHATERYGIQALGEHLTDHFFEVTHTFIDIDNPI